MRLSSLVAYFLRLGATGFGGPIALAGAMERDLVDQRKWFTSEEYFRGLALAQLAPGPLAAQLAIYLGWARGGILGATLVGIAFVLPSFLIVLVLSVLYIRFHGLAWMQSVFYGVGAAVIGIIARSAIKLTRLSLKRDVLLWIVFAVVAAMTAVTENEIVWLFLLSGISVYALRRGVPPASAAILAPWLLTGIRGVADIPLVWRIFLFFTEAGAFVFGSGLAIVPFLYGTVVEQYQWLTQREFVDAVAVAMITPGPVVITVAFIGYLVAGPLGATAAAVAVFLPCYLFVIIPAPYFERYAKKKGIADFVDGVTAAAVGAIAGATIVLGRRALIDWKTMVICLVTFVLVMSTKKIPEPVLIVVAAVAGLLLR
ncbi:MAG: chromate transporter [Acidobacteriota bacterium]|nr:chromate transporter [Acidobacteriota bacterium]